MEKRKKRRKRKSRERPRKRTASVMCCTIRPRSQSDRREATVRSRLLHLLPPSNPRRTAERRAHAPRGHVLLLTHKRSRRSRANVDIKDTCADPCSCTYTCASRTCWIRCARASTRHDRETQNRGLCKRKVHYRTSPRAPTTENGKKCR